MAHEKIRKLERELDHLQSTNLALVDQQKLKEELNTQRARMESILRQKEREIWLKYGDKNSKFFHTSINVRKRKKRIMTIREKMARFKNIRVSMSILSGILKTYTSLASPKFQMRLMSGTKTGYRF